MIAPSAVIAGSIEHLRSTSYHRLPGKKTWIKWYVDSIQELQGEFERPEFCPFVVDNFTAKPHKLNWDKKNHVHGAHVRGLDQKSSKIFYGIVPCCQRCNKLKSSRVLYKLPCVMLTILDVEKQNYIGRIMIDSRKSISWADIQHIKVSYNTKSSLMIKNAEKERTYFDSDSFLLLLLTLQKLSNNAGLSADFTPKALFFQPYQHRSFMDKHSRTNLFSVDKKTFSTREDPSTSCLAESEEKHSTHGKSLWSMSYLLRRSLRLFSRRRKKDNC
mmetsp:Transcript_10504/g.12100  ORF Transcript_10504/g.12100 Transcript_10504/m.12100 type:complete len:273 (+) Transcript_10504:233-1051(+)